MEIPNDPSLDLGIEYTIEVWGSPGTYALGIWHHIVVAQDKRIAKMFIGGAEVNSDITPVAPLNTSLPLFIGWRANWFIDGLIDEVSIYDRALTEPEAQALVNADSAGKCKTIIPTLSAWGLIVFGVLLPAAVAFYIRHRRRPQADTLQG